MLFVFPVAACVCIVFGTLPLDVICISLAFEFGVVNVYFDALSKSTVDCSFFWCYFFFRINEKYRDSQEADFSISNIIPFFCWILAHFSHLIDCF